MSEHTLAALADAIIALMPAKDIELISAGGLHLGNQEIDAIVEGKHFADHTSPEFETWQSDALHEGTEVVIDDLRLAVMDGWRREHDDEDLIALDELSATFNASDEWQRVCDVVWERQADWLTPIVANVGSVLLRVRTAIDEDHDTESMTADDMLTTLGLDITDANRDTAQEIIDNAYDKAVAYFVISVDLSAIWDLPTVVDDRKAMVELVNPGVWLGNPLAGSGYAAQLTGTVRVRRDELMTDRAAFGYGWADLIGGSGKGEFPGEVRLVTETTYAQDRP